MNGEVIALVRRLTSAPITTLPTLNFLVVNIAADRNFISITPLLSVSRARPVRAEDPPLYRWQSFPQFHLVDQDFVIAPEPVVLQRILQVQVEHAALDGIAGIRARVGDSSAISTPAKVSSRSSAGGLRSGCAVPTSNRGVAVDGALDVNRGPAAGTGN